MFGEEWGKQWITRSVYKFALYLKFSFKKGEEKKVISLYKKSIYKLSVTIKTWKDKKDFCVSARNSRGSVQMSNKVKSVLALAGPAAATPNCESR